MHVTLAMKDAIAKQWEGRGLSRQDPQEPCLSIVHKGHRQADQIARASMRDYLEIQITLAHDKVQRESLAAPSRGPWPLFGPSSRDMGKYTPALLTKTSTRPPLTFSASCRCHGCIHQCYRTFAKLQQSCMYSC